MKKQSVYMMGVLLAVTSFSGAAWAKFNYLKTFKQAYPNATQIANCNLCHEPGTDKTKRNYYGQDFQTAGFDFKAIEGLDSDGDGISNIDEINANTTPGVKN